MRTTILARISEEMLLVDLLRNADQLAEDRKEVLPKALKRAKAMDRGRLARAVRDFGSARAGRLLAPVLQDQAARRFSMSLTTLAA